MDGFKSLLALGAVGASAYAVYVAIFLDPHGGAPPRTDVPSVEVGPPSVDVGPPSVGFGDGPPTGGFGIPGRSESAPPGGAPWGGAPAPVGVPPIPGAGPRSVSLSPSSTSEPPPVALSPFDASGAEPVPPPAAVAAPRASAAAAPDRLVPLIPPVAAAATALDSARSSGSDLGPPPAAEFGGASSPATASLPPVGKPASGSLYENPFASNDAPSPAASSTRLAPPAMSAADAAAPSAALDASSSPARPSSPVAAAEPAAPVSLQPAFAQAAPLMEKGELKEALETLSAQYEWAPGKNLSPAEAEELYHKLDQLAGSVVYSRQPWLGEYVTVKASDTLETLAADQRVPWRLLGKINGVAYPDQIQPGDKIKVVPGPFDAVVDLTRRRITLRVAGLYAGRFSFEAGQAAGVSPGKYEVASKREPSNAPGGARVFWIDLGRGQAIYGPSDEKVELGVRNVEGGIQLAARDIEDVFDILSVGSVVEIVGSAAPQAASASDAARFPLR